MKLYAEVVFPLPLSQKFLYQVPEGWQSKAKVGARVLTSFHNRILTGFIVGLKKRRPSSSLRLKDIIEVLDDIPVFSAAFLDFTRILSGYYYSSWGELLQASLPSSFVLKSKPKVRITEAGKKAIAGGDLSSEEKILLQLLHKSAYSERFLQRKSGLQKISALLARLDSRGWIQIDREISRTVRKEALLSLDGPTQLEMDFSLDRELTCAARRISSSVGKRVFSPFLLHGPAERREAIFFNLMKMNMASRRSALFLVPEISLTQALNDKLMKRFGEKAALIHSRMSQRQKEIEWQRIKNGEIFVVAGPRSAVLSPIANLGLIIVDEEQDESYYQKENPSYDARQGAWMRARQSEAVLVFGADTPSLEGFYRAERMKYLVSLDSEPHPCRVTVFECRPSAQIIEFRVWKRIQEKLDRGQQVVVFFNRRGYAPYLICSRCSSIPRCKRCDIGLVYHKKEQKLICHYCNYSKSPFARCPECGEKIILSRSFGIEAIEEELQRLYPRNRIAGFNLDAVRSRKEQEKIVRRFATGKIDILIGTQLLAHRRDIPRVSTVVTLFPETTLALSDFRASHRTYLNLNKMMTFLEREEEAEFLIQTSFSPHYSILHAVEKDFCAFYNQELKYRKIMNYPPFTCMAEILFLGENLRHLAKNSREFLAAIQRETDRIEILGPALASVSRVRGQSRIQVLLKSRKKKDLDGVLSECLPQIKTRKSVSVYE